MATDPVNISPGNATSITTAGQAVQALPANPNGGIIQNPQLAADQGLTTVEPLYVDPTKAPGSTPGSGWGTTFTLLPGQTWTAIPGQLTPTWANAASAKHQFSAIFW